MLGGVGLYGIGVVAFAVSPWFQLSMALMVIVGFANVCSHALVQTGAPGATMLMALAGTLAMFAIHVMIPGARHIR
jgi:hypothetical protein